MLDGDAERVEENEEDDEPEEQLMFHRLTNKVPDDIESLVTRFSYGIQFLFIVYHGSCLTSSVFGYIRGACTYDVY